MLLTGLSLALAWLGPAAAMGSMIPPECRGLDLVDSKPCRQPIEDILAVTPGVFYTAKIRCYNCSYSEWITEGPDVEDRPGDTDLVSMHKAA